MKTSDFDYPLPAELIAQYPPQERDRCRLLFLPRETGDARDCEFKELLELLVPGDRLVFNDTRVIPARLFCRKESGGKAELLLMEPETGGGWRALVRPGRGLTTGTRICVADEPGIRINVVAVHDDGSRSVKLLDENALSFPDVLAKYGVMALPHYIKRPAVDDDKVTYQTIFAARDGAIASPTAGLHFTPVMMDALAAKGIDSSRITLHVGVGTFKPVTADDPRDHAMHEERYELSEKTVTEITKTRESGGRIVAVGTTVVRVLEHCAGDDGILRPSVGTTRLMILPGYRFKAIDGMMTNFHVPKSTLLMLVSAFAGRERVLEAYRHAVREKYRFFSYGDAMAIL
jgi:S-adenosylmethionine:tRNA ribosyltransferase-isomerase